MFSCFHSRIFSRVSGSLVASRPPQASAANARKMGMIFVMPMNLAKMTLPIMAASLQVPFSTPNAVHLRKRDVQTSVGLGQVLKGQFTTVVLNRRVGRFWMDHRCLSKNYLVQFETTCFSLGPEAKPVENLWFIVFFQWPPKSLIMNNTDVWYQDMDMGIGVLCTF